LLYSIKALNTVIFVLVMSLTFTLSGHSSELSSNFYPPIQLNSKSKYGLALLGFYTYNSIFNVDESNNCFGYLKNNKIIKLSVPPGAYEISEIHSAMLEALKESTKDKRDNIFLLKANNTTLTCEIESKYDIVFEVENPISKILGFNQGRLKSNQKHTSTSTVDIMKVRIIRVDSNVTSGAYINSQECHTIFEFDIDVEPGYKITKEPSNLIYMPIKPDGRQFIDNITLRILDDSGDLINFRGEKVIVKLELKELSF
jgi:hypothetical protein